MLRRIAQLLTVFLAVPAPALAADLTFRLGGDAEYDSNAFRRSGDEKDEFFFRIRPGIEVHEDRGQDVNFSVGYEFPVEFAVKNSNELNDYDHIALGDVTYHANDRLDVFASEDFRYLRSILRQEFDSSGILSGAGLPLIDTSRERVTLNTAQLGATYRFTPRLSGTASAQHRYFDSTRDDRQKNWALFAVGDLNYVLTAKHSVGAGVRYIRQDFEETTQIAGSVTDTYNGYLTWRYQVTPNTVFSAAVGPSFIQVASEEPSAISGVTPIPVLRDTLGNQYVYLLAGCPFLPGSTTDRYIPVSGCGLRSAALTAAEIATVDGVNATKITIVNDDLGGDRSDNLTVFGNLMLSQRWTPNIASALRYDRSQGSASGLGGAVTLDAVSFSTTWDFAERWQFAFRGDWTRRQSVADVVQIFYKAQDPSSIAIGGNDVAEFSNQATTLALSTSRIETNRWGLAGRVTHQVWRNTRVFLQLAYNEQTSEASSLGSPTDFEDWLVTLGIRHVFEPIKLW